MSTVSENGRFVTLDNCRVFYNRKDDTISLTSTDESVAGKPFRVTLKAGTDSEETLRELLTEHGVITQEDVAQYDIPFRVKYPKYSEEQHALILPLGVDEKMQAVSVDLRESSNVFVCGSAGKGKSTFVRNALLHTSHYDNTWHVYGVDLAQTEMFHHRNVRTVRQVASTVESAALMIRELHEMMTLRYEEMLNEGLSRNTATVLFVLSDMEAFIHHFSEAGFTEELRMFRTLTEQDPKAGIHLLITNPRAVDISYMLTFDTKIVLGGSSETLRTVLGSSFGKHVPNIIGRGGVMSSGLIENTITGQNNRLDGVTNRVIQTYYSAPDFLHQWYSDFRNDNG